MMRSRCSSILYALPHLSAIMRQGRGDCAELAIKKRAASKVLYQQRIGKLRTYSMGQQQPSKPLPMMRSRCPPIPYALLTPLAIMRQGRGDCAVLAIKKSAASKVLYQQRIGKWRSARKQSENRKKGREILQKRKRIWKLYFSAG
ncbi:hypothetical protein CDAR_522151 [Caerostris darwini]|uniref:Uncharacterized protein n=1 Tax=Caerostris darwini TaxID=1538125 RepID=A0AAV4SQY5_9ARAC|nr:hypothetical protein CDAR_522151 [Caerostris darwini]